MMWYRRLCAAIALALPGYSLAAAPLLVGGDVSMLPFIESRGGTFRDAGVVTPAERIMVDHGANTFRLRLFVNPNLNYSATNGAIQDLASTIAMAQRIKQSGSKVLLDFQYSDSWADPSKQTKPAAWASLSNDALKQRVRDYTRESLQAFRAAGAMPDLVQVGNETTNGMLWSSGQVVYTGTAAVQNASWAAFGGLLNAAIGGVRDVDAQTGRHTAVAIHVDGGDVDGRAQYFFNKLATVGGVSPSSYDIAGLSYYPTTTSAMTNLQANMTYAATTLGRQVMILETNAPWKGTATGSGYAATATGQRDFFVAVRSAVAALPNERGLGVLWWYPEAIQLAGTNIWKGGAIAMFDDSGGDALASIDALQLPAPTWAIDSNGAWSSPGNWALGVPDGVGAVARFGTAIHAGRSVALDSPRTVGTMRFQGDASYTLGGTARLTLSNGTAQSRIDVLDGTHVIDVPLAYTGTLEMNAAWTSTLVSEQPLTGSGTITKLGSGIWEAASMRVGQLDIDYGTLRLRSQPASTPTASTIVAGLNIGIGGKLDITNNTVVIDPVVGVGTAAMLESIRLAVVEGQLVSSTADANAAIGYAVDASSDRTAFDGRPIDRFSIVIRLTRPGDADVNGRVDFADLVALAQSYNATGATWQRGDFNYDDSVDFADLVALAQHYNQSLPIGAPASFGISFVADWALARSLVPEPAAPFAIAAMTLIGRRRRSLD